MLLIMLNFFVKLTKLRLGLALPKLAKVFMPVVAETFRFPRPSLVGKDVYMKTGIHPMVNGENRYILSNIKRNT